MINQTRHSDELLARTKNAPPSFTIHLDHKHWSLNNGSKLLYHNQIASLLDDVRAHRIPADLQAIFASANTPFYDGNMIVELIDHRQSPPDVNRVVLYPDSESLYADICALATDDLTAAQIESGILLATAPPLCLDPDPHLTRIVNHVLRVSTPTPPPSLKRKASAGSGLDNEQDESERARRAKIMSFMSPRPRGAPTFRVLEAVQQLRNRLQTNTQPAVQSSSSEERKEEPGTIAPSMMFKSGKLPGPSQPQKAQTPVQPQPPPAPSPAPSVTRVPSVQPQAPIQTQTQPQSQTLTQQQNIYSKHLQQQQDRMARMSAQANAITSLANPTSSPRPPSTMLTHATHPTAATPQIAQMHLNANPQPQPQQNPQPQPAQPQVQMQAQTTTQMQAAMQQHQAYAQHIMNQQRYWAYLQGLTADQRVQWMASLQPAQRVYIQNLLRSGAAAAAAGQMGVKGVQGQPAQQR